jgi:hypothetical protein
MREAARRLKRSTMLRSGRLLVAIFASLLLSGPLRAAEKPDVRAKLTASGRPTVGSKIFLAVELTIGAGWHVFLPFAV